MKIYIKNFIQTLKRLRPKTHLKSSKYNLTKYQTYPQGKAFFLNSIDDGILNIRYNTALMTVGKITCTLNTYSIKLFLLLLLSMRYIRKHIQYNFCFSEGASNYVYLNIITCYSLNRALGQDSVSYFYSPVFRRRLKAVGPVYGTVTFCAR